MEQACWPIWKPGWEMVVMVGLVIREADCFDKVMEFAGAIADTEDLTIMAAHCDSGDHLHPSSLGGYQMAAHACEILMQA
jgi:hypothetical protein